MKNQKSAYKSNSEKWKYTNINQFDTYDFNFKPTNKKINRTCKENEILLHNSTFYKCGNKLTDKKISVCNINESKKKQSYLSIFF